MTIQFFGSPSKCYFCDEVSTDRMGIVYQCARHKFINDIVLKAQSVNVLIVKNGEYWDYKSDILREFIEAKLAEFLA